MDKDSNKNDDKPISNHDDVSSEPKALTITPNASASLVVGPVSEYLELFTKASGVLVVLAVAFGGFNIYAYLTIIGQTSLFPAIIDLSGSFVAIMVAFFIFWFVIAMGLFSPWFVLIFLKNIQYSFGDKTRCFLRYVYGKFVIFAIVLFCLPYLLGDRMGWDSVMYCIIVLAAVLDIVGIYYLRDRTPSKGKISIETIFLFPLLNILALLFFILIICLMVLVGDQTYQILRFVVTVFILTLFLLMSYWVCLEYINTGKIQWQYCFVGIAAAFFISLIVVPLSNYNIPLRQLRFIEKPKDAKWYLVANQGTKDEPRFLTSLTKDDLSSIKKSFIVPDCNEFTDGEKQKCEYDNQSVLNERPEALYGYMAWNLGNERIFCPKSADFFAKNGSGNNKPMGNSCLTVIGNQLQPISAGMLK